MKLGRVFLTLTIPQTKQIEWKIESFERRPLKRQPPGPTGTPLVNRFQSQATLRQLYRRGWNKVTERWGEDTDRLSAAAQADRSICGASLSQSRMDEGAGLFSPASPHMLLSGGCTARALTWLQPGFSSGRWVWERWLFLLALLDDLPG